MGTKILVVDNYDSFVFNLVQYLQQLGAECTVVRNDQVSPQLCDQYDGVLISPGPGTPENAGISVEMIKRSAQISKPLLGVCLGHQGIGVAFGGKVSRVPELLHGKTSVIIHNNSGVLKDIPNNFIATRYHSLAIDEESLPDEIEITGRSQSGFIMAIRHKSLPIHGVQFHPESVLTEHGYQILGNWLVECGDIEARSRSQGLSPVLAR